MKQNWIIIVDGNDTERVWVHRVRGTKEQVKEYMIYQVHVLETKYEKEWDFGTENVSEVEDYGDELYAFGVFSEGFQKYCLAWPESVWLKEEPTEL